MINCKIKYIFYTISPDLDNRWFLKDYSNKYIYCGVIMSWSNSECIVGKVYLIMSYNVFTQNVMYMFIHVKWCATVHLSVLCFRLYEYNRLNIIICTHFNSNFQGCCLSRMFGMFLQISFGSSLPLFCGPMRYLITLRGCHVQIDLLVVCCNL